MSDPARRMEELIAAAERSMKSAHRAILALESVIGQAKGIIAELREVHEQFSGPAGPAKRRDRAKVGP